MSWGDASECLGQEVTVLSGRAPRRKRKDTSILCGLGSSPRFACLVLLSRVIINKRCSYYSHNKSAEPSGRESRCRKSRKQPHWRLREHLELLQLVSDQRNALRRANKRQRPTWLNVFRTLGTVASRWSCTAVFPSTLGKTHCALPILVAPIATCKGILQPMKTELFFY